MQMRVLLAALALGTGTGCVRAREVNLATILSDHRENPVAAMQKYREGELLVRGRVRDIGVYQKEHIAHELYDSQLGFEGSSRHASVPVPFVHLLASDEAGALCYFDRAKTSDAARLRRGDEVALRCRFQELSEQGASGPVVVFNDCELGAAH